MSVLHRSTSTKSAVYQIDGNVPKFIENKTVVIVRLKLNKLLKVRYFARELKSKSILKTILPIITNFDA